MTERPNNAPRCFGLGSCFGADPSICGVCRCHDECLSLAKISLEKTNQIIGENNVALMHVSVKIDEAKELVACIKSDTLPKGCGVTTSKLATLVRQITANNPCAADYLNSGRNPFSLSAKPAHLKPLTDHLLMIDNSEDGLIEFLMKVFDKTRKQAEELVRLYIAALKVLGYKN